MRTLLIVSILALSLISVACSPHRGWYNDGYRGGYHGGCGYWNGPAYDYSYDSPYPAQSYGSGYAATPYSGN